MTIKTYSFEDGKYVVERDADTGLIKDIRRHGEPWPAGMGGFQFANMFHAALNRIDELSPLRTLPDGSFIRAVKDLCVAARTTGGTAGRDEGLCAALDRVEAMLANPDFLVLAFNTLYGEGVTEVCENHERRVISVTWRSTDVPSHQPDPAAHKINDLIAKAARYDWLRAGTLDRLGMSMPARGERVIERNRDRNLMVFNFWCTPEELDAAIDKELSK